MKILDFKNKFNRTIQHTPSAKNLEDKRLILELLIYLTTKKVEMLGNIDWYDLYSDKKKTNIHIFSHNSPYSWVASAPIVVKNLMDHSQSERQISAVFHRWLYFLPFFKSISELFGSHKETFHSLEKKLRESSVTDVGIYPEGQNCMFGNGLDIQPFKSGRFLELALKTNSKIILYTFSGPEIWCKPIPLGQLNDLLLKAFLPKSLSTLMSDIHQFALPVLPKRIEKLTVNTQIYEPQLKLEKLNSNKKIRNQQLLEEADYIRFLMQDMLNNQILNTHLEKSSNVKIHETKEIFLNKLKKVS